MSQLSNSLDKYILDIKGETDIFTKAKLISHLNKGKQVRIIEIARKLGIKPSYVCHILRLTRLPEIIIDGYYSKLISLSHLFVISRLKDEKKLLPVYEQILSKNLTVQETEEIVREILYQIKTKGTRLTKEEIAQFINRLKGQNINAKVIQTRIKGKIIFEVKGSLEQTTVFIRKIIKKILDKSE